MIYTVLRVLTSAWFVQSFLNEDQVSHNDGLGILALISPPEFLRVYKSQTRESPRVTKVLMSDPWEMASRYTLIP